MSKKSDSGTFRVTLLYRPTLKYEALYDNELYYPWASYFSFSIECFLHQSSLKRLVWQELRTSLVSWYRFSLRPLLSLCKMVVRGVALLATQPHWNWQRLAG